MCGFVGIWNKNGKPVDLEQLALANSTIRHRGPDDEGYLLINSNTGRVVSCGGNDTMPGLSLPDINELRGDEFNIGFGFRRLAIQDLSIAGHQPMQCHNSNRWLLFNGEIYNYIEIREELKSFGYKFTSNSDSEVVLASYDKWGSKCLDKFNGMWAFVIIEIEHNAPPRLFVSRDRFGIKPLFYSQCGDGYYFASEPKALIRSELVNWDVNHESAYHYFVHGNLPTSFSGDTMYANIDRLPPASTMTITREKCETCQYWELPEFDGIERNDKDLLEELDDLLVSAVDLRMRSDVPVGSCLSGGLDSSLIVSLINSSLIGGSESRQKTFSAVYDIEGSFNESEHIAKVVNDMSIDDHYTIPTSEGLVEKLNHLIWTQDEPFQGTSIYAQYCVMESVKTSGVKVLLDGQGADELFGGYMPFIVFLRSLGRKKGQMEAWRQTRKCFHIPKTKAMAQYMFSLGMNCLPSGLDGRVFGLMQNARQTRKVRESCMQMDFQNTFESNARASLNSTAGAVQYAGDDLNEHLGKITHGVGLELLLRHEDRNSMAFSVESRVPFLDYRLVDFAFRKCQDGIKIKDGWSKWALRKVANERLPKAIAWRKDKVGFATPESIFIKAAISSQRDMLSSNNLSSSYLDWDRINKTLHEKPDTGESMEMWRRRWRWVNFEMWMRNLKANTGVLKD